MIALPVSVFKPGHMPLGSTTSHGLLEPQLTKMEITLGMWIANVVGIITLLGWGLWWWNYFRFALPVTFWRFGGRTTMKLPPGHMGIPFFGEMLHFLLYFKVIHRHDDFINNKRYK